MKKLSLGFAILAMVVVLPATAAESCSIHPAKGLLGAQLRSLAKVSQADADRIAVAKIRGKEGVSVASAELEGEHQCSIWSFDVRVAGRPGVEESQVDAGNGKVLSVKHESAAQEATDASQEKAITRGESEGSGGFTTTEPPCPRIGDRSECGGGKRMTGDK